MLCHPLVAPGEQFLVGHRATSEVYWRNLEAGEPKVAPALDRLVAVIEGQQDVIVRGDLALVQFALHNSVLAEVTVGAHPERMEPHLMLEEPLLCLRPELLKRPGNQQNLPAPPVEGVHGFRDGTVQ